ncbi:hypothetical protein [Komagataeibacter xylinus]|nr:hypothetical protein [Komagataeibacter xylinus]
MKKNGTQELLLFIMIILEAERFSGAGQQTIPPAMRLPDIPLKQDVFP